MNYALRLHNKLVMHNDNKLIAIHEDFDGLMKLAEKACDQYEEMKEEIDEFEYKKEEDDNSETSKWGLLGEQIATAFDECMTNPKVNQIVFLEILEGIAINGTSKIMKVA